MIKVFIHILYYISMTFIFFSCGDVIKITSPNEPKDDSSALTLVGITMTPEPVVEFRKFEGGLDDSMRMVIRFPKSRLDEFWSASPWKAEKKSEVDLNKPQTGTLLSLTSNLNRGFEKKWTEWKSSKHYIFSEAQLPQAQHVEILLALDQGGEEIVAYIFWI